jgi:hypothetical protein
MQDPGWNRATGSRLQSESAAPSWTQDTSKKFDNKKYQSDSHKRAPPAALAPSFVRSIISTTGTVVDKKRLNLSGHELPELDETQTRYLEHSRFGLPLLSKEIHYPHHTIQLEVGLVAGRCRVLLS